MWWVHCVAVVTCLLLTSPVLSQVSDVVSPTTGPVYKCMEPLHVRFFGWQSTQPYAATNPKFDEVKLYLYDKDTPFAGPRGYIPKDPADRKKYRVTETEVITFDVKNCTLSKPPATCNRWFLLPPNTVPGTYVLGVESADSITKEFKEFQAAFSKPFTVTCEPKPKPEKKSLSQQMGLDVSSDDSDEDNRMSDGGYAVAKFQVGKFDVRIGVNSRLAPPPASAFSSSTGKLPTPRPARPTSDEYVPPELRGRLNFAYITDEAGPVPEAPSTPPPRPQVPQSRLNIARKPPTKILDFTKYTKL